MVVNISNTNISIALGRCREDYQLLRQSYPNQGVGDYCHRKAIFFMNFKHVEQYKHVLSIGLTEEEYKDFIFAMDN